jgi:hypothetical protein
VGYHRHRAVVATLVVSTAAVGCGGGSGRPADAAGVRQTVTRFLHALGRGDGAAVCALATPAGRALLSGSVPHHTCAQVISLVSRRLRATTKAGMESVHVGKVTIHNGHASVSNTSITSSHGSLASFLKPGSPPTLLTKQSDGSWRITG